MRILTRVELADFAEKNGKIIRILKKKTAELADFAEKSPKRMNTLKEREFECCSPAERIEVIAIQCTFVMQSPREMNLPTKFHLFPMLLKTYPFMKQCSVRSLN